MPVGSGLSLWVDPLLSGAGTDVDDGLDVVADGLLVELVGDEALLDGLVSGSGSGVPVLHAARPTAIMIPTVARGPTCGSPSTACREG